jgi:hypothetical protein
MASPVQRLLAALRQDGGSQVALVHGDLVLAEPAALEVATALAERHGGRVESHRHPASLVALLQDLRTFSLFGGAKVLLAIDTAVFADRSGAADLIDDAEDALPPPRAAGGASGGRAAPGDGPDNPGDPANPGDHRAGRRPSAAAAAATGSAPGEGALSARQRQAASRLLQALRLFEIAPGRGAAEEVIGQLPGWVLEGGRAARKGRAGRARGKRQIEDLRLGLVALLEAARREGIEGSADGDLSDLATLITGGLPAGHALVFAEREVAADHPLVRLLADRDAVAAVGVVAADRGGFQGVDLVAEELAAQTGVGISAQALAELVRRTLRKAAERSAGGRGGDGARGPVTADSTARLAGEYRKLANLAQGAGSARIELNLVEEAVEDRGDEDVWKLLDAIGGGQPGEALDRLQRLLASADDPLAERLSFFSLLANFCRRLTLVRGMMRVVQVPGGESNYSRFAARLAPALQGELADGKNPLAGIHPYALHRAYLAASRLSDEAAARLPWEILETELQLKGESTDADAALARLVVQLGRATTPPGARRDSGKSLA